MTAAIMAALDRIAGWWEVDGPAIRLVFFLALVTLGLIVLLSSPVLAVEFKCGKEFITFTHEPGKKHSRAHITLPKKDILRVFRNFDVPDNVMGPRIWILYTLPFGDQPWDSRPINAATHRQIVECLD